MLGTNKEVSLYCSEERKGLNFFHRLMKHFRLSLESFYGFYELQKCSDKTKIKLESDVLWPSFPRRFIFISFAFLSLLAFAIEE